jgi:hypothetical protein
MADSHKTEAKWPLVVGMVSLTVAGLALAVVALVMHFRVDIASRVTESIPHEVPLGSSTEAPLRPSKETVTEAGTSDTLTVSLVGLGAALLVVGAALPRITKISFAGTNIELGERSILVAQEIGKQITSYRSQLGDDPAQIAATTAAAVIAATAAWEADARRRRPPRGRSQRQFTGLAMGQVERPEAYYAALGIEEVLSE